MKSLKNHLSLIVALFTVLFAVQIYVAVDRTIAAYETHLKNDYSIIVVSNKAFTPVEFKAMDTLIDRSEAIATDQVLDRLQGEMTKKNLDLLKLTLPKFYRLYLNRFPTPSEIQNLQKRLQKNPAIVRVEGYAQTHDTVYKLMLLFKDVVQVFSIAIAAVTSLLILKEMRLWQFQHSERMSIMALFGAPVWLRSAVLFRLAIVDAIIATGILCLTFFIIAEYGWMDILLQTVGIKIELFNFIDDSLRSLLIALGVSIVLTLTIVIGNEEEE
ncbi:MAG: cell division protein FtsX [Sulfuricurvum sp.]|uniref:cell division protein FtsX n=1 Tax=Sulfuricurvum sp. TaxID=2025608 RepID=UPI00260F630B|nr:cell division protein FtsX [Sulfuricurvum sp.]MDD2369152.1 cell division protein FtsX [Sulfuricurvum sp.]MDD2949541.1 cell division protein FtsX [Sulfuricurvum sp.]MDD5118747.1 cell division protein FtsX [Sulfuricurvum sp.]